MLIQVPCTNCTEMSLSPVDYICRCSLHILVLDMWPYSVVCLYTLFKVSFKRESLILMQRRGWAIFSFMDSFLGPVRKSFRTLWFHEDIFLGALSSKILYSFTFHILIFKPLGIDFSVNNPAFMQSQVFQPSNQFSKSPQSPYNKSSVFSR